MPSNTPETQSLLPVTQADRDAAADFHHVNGFGPMQSRRMTADEMRNGRHDRDPLVKAFARHRISHSLPGDVGTIDPDHMSVEMATLFGLVCKMSRLRTEHDDILRASSGTLESIEQAANRVDQIVDAIPELRDAFAGAHAAEMRLRAALTPSALSVDNSQSSNAGGVDVEALRKALYPFSRAWKYWSELKRLKPDAEGVDEGPKGFVIPSEFRAAHEALASLSTPTAEPTPTPDRIGKDAVREALKPFADKASMCDFGSDDYCPDWSPFIPVGAYRNAARALTATPAQEGEGDD